MLVKLLIPEHSGIKDKYTALTTEGINILQMLANMGKRIPADISNNLRRARLAFTTGNIKNAVKFYMAAIEKMIKLLSKSQYRYHYKDTVEIGTSFKVNTSFKEKSIQTDNTNVNVDRSKEETQQGDNITAEKVSGLVRYDFGDYKSQIEEEYHGITWHSLTDNTDANLNIMLNSMPSTGDENISSLISPVNSDFLESEENDLEITTSESHRNSSMALTTPTKKGRRNESTPPKKVEERTSSSTIPLEIGGRKEPYDFWQEWKKANNC